MRERSVDVVRALRRCALRRAQPGKLPRDDETRCAAHHCGAQLVVVHVEV